MRIARVGAGSIAYALEQRAHLSRRLPFVAIALLEAAWPRAPQPPSSDLTHGRRYPQCVSCKIFRNLSHASGAHRVLCSRASTGPARTVEQSSSSELPTPEGDVLQCALLPFRLFFHDSSIRTHRPRPRLRRSGTCFPRFPSISFCRSRLRARGLPKVWAQVSMILEYFIHRLDRLRARRFKVRGRCRAGD